MKKIISLSLGISLLTLATFGIFESEVTTAAAASDTVTVSLIVTSGISITTPADVSLKPDLVGFTGGGYATNTVTWNVKTSNDTGYNIGVKASTDPALKIASFSFANYTPTGGTATPDYTWGIGAAISEFGFSPYNATNQVAKFKNDGASKCATGSTVTTWRCFFPFGTSDTQVANRATKTTTAGEDTIIDLEAQIDVANGYQEDGTYTATITATATEN